MGGILKPEGFGDDLIYVGWGLPHHYLSFPRRRESRCSYAASRSATAHAVVKTLAADLAMHVTAANPLVLSSDYRPATSD